MAAATSPRVSRHGRYALSEPIASGGMASVHLARLLGHASFARTVAVKRLHPHLAGNAEVAVMFLDEARLVSRITHPNVVATLDVVADADDVLIIMEYIHGESLARVLRATKGGIPCAVAVALACDLLHGLHAAHEARSDLGIPLEMVHRDVSPQNILIGVDGVARVADFGIAKARVRSAETRDGVIKGKLAYMAPEQLSGGDVDRRTDVFATGAVLWEALTGKSLFVGDNEAELLLRVLTGTVPPPSSAVAALASDHVAGIDAVVLRALSRDPDDRFATADEFAAALQKVVSPAPKADVAAWLLEILGPAIAKRDALVAAFERATATSPDAADAPTAPPAVVVGPRVASDPPRSTTLAMARQPISVAPAERRSKTPYFFAAGLAALGVVAILFATRKPQTAALAAAPPAASVVASPEVASAAQPSTSLVALPAPIAAPPLAKSPVARPKHTTRGNPSSAASSAPPPPADCDPAYTRDESGVIHHKPQCLVE